MGEKEQVHTISFLFLSPSSLFFFCHNTLGVVGWSLLHLPQFILKLRVFMPVHFIKQVCEEDPVRAVNIHFFGGYQQKIN